MKKKVLSLLLASAMVVSLAACGSSDSGSSAGGAGSSGTADNSSAAANNGGGTDSNSGGESSGYNLTQIVMAVDGTLTANLDNGQADFEKQWEEAVGIDLVINQYDHSKYAETIGRMFVGGDYPDVLIMSASMYSQYATTGLLWDMTEAYENAEFQSRVTAPEINEQLKRGGKLYGFAPAYGNGCVTYIKKAWLDAVGLSVDDIKTFDDYYNMLLAFHNGDPDGNGINGDTYGVVAAGYLNTGEAPYINYMPEFWQDAYPVIHQDENGVWIDGFNQDSTKQALLRLRQGYLDGAIDPDTLNFGTKQAREKWFSNDQTGSSGAFTYWAGTWYQTLTDNLIKQGVDAELVQLPPIAEVGAYINREAPVWCIIDDGDGDDSREQAIFDAFIATMLDGDRVQTLWTYGAEGVHWSVAADDFVTNPGTDNEKSYHYEEGEFHLLPSPGDSNSIWKKNAMDPALVIATLENGYTQVSGLAAEGNAFFTANCKDAPMSPSSETFTNESGTIFDAINVCLSDVIINGVDVDTAMETYQNTVGSIVAQCLEEMNSAE